MTRNGVDLCGIHYIIIVYPCLSPRTLPVMLPRNLLHADTEHVILSNCRLYIFVPMKSIDVFDMRFLRPILCIEASTACLICNSYAT